MRRQEGSPVEVASALQAKGVATVWTFLSQGSSSLSNLLVLVAVSHSGSASDVGAVAVGLLVYQLLVGAFRTLFGEVALISASRLDDALVASMFHALVKTGSMASAMLILIAVMLDGFVLSPLFVLGLLLIPLLLQDSLRYVSFARLNPRSAAFGDGAWVLAFITTVVALARLEVHPSAGQWIGIWSCCGIAAIAVMSPHLWRHTQFRPELWRDVALPLSRFYFPEFVLGICITIVPPLLIATIASLEEAGALRLAASYFGPITVTWAAFTNLYIPRRVRRGNESIRPEVLLSAGFVMVTLGWLALGLALPGDLATAVLGETWTVSRDWLPTLGLGYVALASSCGAILGLRVHNASNLAVRSRTVAAPLAALGTVVGFELWGPLGYGWGFTVACTLISVCAWRYLVLRRYLQPEALA